MLERRTGSWSKTSTLRYIGSVPSQSDHGRLHDGGELMADQVIRVVAKFSDQAGANTRSLFLIKRASDVDGSLIKSETNAHAGAIVGTIEAMSLLKFEEATVLVPLSLGGLAVKTSPTSGSSVKKEGWIEFFGGLGDSLKRSKTRIWIPSPKDAVLAGNNTRFDFNNADVQALRDQVVAIVKTLGGTNVETVGSSNVRIRRTRK
jgi:hypothetical protein